MLEREQFTEAADEIVHHPFLIEAANGTLPLEKWARYFSARLEAGPGFVSFLRRLQAQAEAAGERAIALAAKKNLDEELGVFQGQVHIERAHHQWRAWFRDGIKRVFADLAIEIPSGPPADFTEVHGYTQTFNSLNDSGDVHESMGALGVLEIGLGKEYEQVLQGLAQLFPVDTLTAREWTYLRSHAIHDFRHFDEVFVPLKEACRTEDHEKSAARGITTALRTKIAFLDGAYRPGNAA